MTHTIGDIKNLSKDSSSITPGEPTIILTGSTLVFSDRLVGVLRAEFADCRFQRAATLADVAVSRRLHNVRLVIFDEAHVSDIIQNPTAYLDATSDASVVIACTSDQMAAEFLTARPDSGELDKVGLLPLNAQMDIWIAVMHLFLCGQNFIGQNLLREIGALKTKPEPFFGPNEPAHLTPREWEVLGMVAEGHQNKTIALELGLSLHTVKLHIHNILKKTEQTNRTGAANWYMQLNNSGAQTPNASHA